MQHHTYIYFFLIALILGKSRRTLILKMISMCVDPVEKKNALKNVHGLVESISKYVTILT